YHKYFENTKSYRTRFASDLFSLHSGKLSPFDDIIRKYADSLDWDWRLFAAQIYQESQFDPKIKGRLGAGGLLQIMPQTAHALGVKNLFNPEDNLKGGIRYLKRLYNRFDKVTDSVQRIKFTLAAFNC